MNRDAARPSGFHGLIRQIGYTAMGVGSAAAAVYGITRAFRKRDLSALWAFDPHAAPPMFVQQQLRVRADSDDDNDVELLPKRPRRTIRETTQERGELEEEMLRAMGVSIPPPVERSFHGVICPLGNGRPRERNACARREACDAWWAWAIVRG